MRKIAVSLTKGGVGKTTTAVNLAAGLALTGVNVLLVDTDTQGQAGFMLGVDAPNGLPDVLAGSMKLEEAVVEARDCLWLLAGGRELAGVKRDIDQQAFGGERVLSDALSQIDQSFTYVILDTSPGWDTMTINTLFYAGEVLVPVSVEVLALKGLSEFNTSLNGMQKYKTISLSHVLPTFLDGRVRKSGEILAQLQSFYDQQLCPPIRYNVRLSEAAGFGQTIFEYAPKSPGAEDYRRLIERIDYHGYTQKNT